MSNQHARLPPKDCYSLIPETGERLFTSIIAGALLLALPFIIYSQGASPAWVILGLLGVVSLLGLVLALIKVQLIEQVLRGRDHEVVALSLVWTELLRAHVIGNTETPVHGTWVASLHFRGWFRPRRIEIFAGPAQSRSYPLVPGDSGPLLKKLMAATRDQMGPWHGWLLWMLLNHYQQFTIEQPSAHALMAARLAARQRTGEKTMALSHA